MYLIASERTVNIFESVKISAFTALGISFHVMKSSHTFSLLATCLLNNP